ncbi:hypothetical protein [Clostridium tarantellae]|uniref:YCII-related domain-containing protein n=1 Tax=Clostridium tarantellae TaxID=39493 RepID=A0A6I1MQF9_9CLOT|nr:hypothetical protein [Clostridium tarantellae]MPQ44387.1 hypothetical protein [Clostridium tarantellae]
MIKSSGIFVKINYKLQSCIKNNRSHLAKTYKDSNKPKYILCAGIYNKNGGTIIFHANNFKEAENIINNNPFINAENYSFEILSKNYINLSTIGIIN